MMKKIEPAEYLLIAEAILDIDAERLARTVDMGGLLSALDAPFAEWGDRVVYPTLSKRAAILCSRLLRNRPLLDGNKRVAFLTMLEFVFRNGSTWVPPATEESIAQVGRLAAREISEDEFARWVKSQLA